MNNPIKKSQPNDVSLTGKISERIFVSDENQPYALQPSVLFLYEVVLSIFLIVFSDGLHLYQLLERLRHEENSCGEL